MNKTQLQKKLKRSKAKLKEAKEKLADWDTSFESFIQPEALRFKESNSGEVRDATGRAVGGSLQGAFNRPRTGVSFAVLALGVLDHVRRTEFHRTVIQVAQENVAAGLVWGAYEHLLRATLKELDPSQLVLAWDAMNEGSRDGVNAIVHLVWGNTPPPIEWEDAFDKALLCEPVQKKKTGVDWLDRSLCPRCKTPIDENTFACACVGQRLPPKEDPQEEEKEAAKHS